jgi:hypothetical protein
MDSLDGIFKMIRDLSSRIDELRRRVDRLTSKERGSALIGATLTGGGTIATGGYTLTMTGSSTINGTLVGSMTGSGTVITGGNNLTVGGTSTINGSVVGSMTGSGTVATGGYTLTVPATGTASLLGAEQTYTSVKTFSAGISLGNETLSVYDEGTWTPSIVGATGTPTGRTYTTRVGRYVRIGKLCFYSFFISISAVGSGDSGDARVSLPVAAANVADYDYVAAPWWSSGANYTNTPIGLVFQVVRNTSYGIVIATYDDATAEVLPISGFANSDYFQASGFYFTA